MNETPEQKFTRREMEVLALASEGLFHREIAETLAIHRRTLSLYLKNIYDKLEVSNTQKAWRKAQALGILHVDQRIKFEYGTNNPSEASRGVRN